MGKCTIRVVRLNGTHLRLTRRHCEDAYTDVGGRAKHDSREGGGRAKQDARAEEARAELAQWQECYKDVAFTEARDLIPFGRWSQHCLEIPSLGP